MFPLVKKLKVLTCSVPLKTLLDSTRASDKCASFIPKVVSLKRALFLNKLQQKSSEQTYTDFPVKACLFVVSVTGVFAGF